MVHMQRAASSDVQYLISVWVSEILKLVYNLEDQLEQTTYTRYLVRKTTHCIWTDIEKNIWRMSTDVSCICISCMSIFSYTSSYPMVLSFIYSFVLLKLLWILRGAWAFSVPLQAGEGAMEIVEENQGKSHWEKHEETHQLQMHESFIL